MAPSIHPPGEYLNGLATYTIFCGSRGMNRNVYIVRAVTNPNDCIAYCERTAASQAVAFDEQTHSSDQKSEGPVAVVDGEGAAVDGGGGGSGVGDASDPGPCGGDTGFEVVEGREGSVFAYKRDSVGEATITANEAPSPQDSRSETGTSVPPTTSSPVVAATTTFDSSRPSSGTSTTVASSSSEIVASSFSSPSTASAGSSTTTATRSSSSETGSSSPFLSSAAPAGRSTTTSVQSSTSSRVSSSLLYILLRVRAIRRQ